MNLIATILEESKEMMKKKQIEQWG